MIRRYGNEMIISVLEVMNQSLQAHSGPASVIVITCHSFPKRLFSYGLDFQQEDFG